MGKICGLATLLGFEVRCVRGVLPVFGHNALLQKWPNELSLCSNSVPTGRYRILNSEVMKFDSDCTDLKYLNTRVCIIGITRRRGRWRVGGSHTYGSLDSTPVEPQASSSGLDLTNEM
ncbi:jg3707 [Pararge aegeria aegeria]|uniref:Jg3707 protein n=1 Tax=Pararge aegeria aegeria TaxID=348720 RepID=A0A8S4SBP5_9NEOP|nr:jg3707 [Pararge aegeria aegeria]